MSVLFWKEEIYMIIFTAFNPTSNISIIDNHTNQINLILKKKLWP